MYMLNLFLFYLISAASSGEYILKRDLNATYLVLFLVGILIVLRSKKQIYLLMGISTVLIISLNSLTIDGDYRRNLLILPFIFIMIGVAIQYICTLFPSRK